MKASLGLLLLLTACAPTIAGQLKGPDGGIVAGPEARVNVVSLANGTEGEAKTFVAVVGDDGKFSLSEDLPAGEYLVEALVPGYAPASERVKLDEADHIELTLKPVGAAKAQAIGANVGVDEGRGAGGATLTPPSL
jgi:hypothetical protein